MNFLWCTMTGFGALVVFLAIFAAVFVLPVALAGMGIEKLRQRIRGLDRACKKFGKAIATVTVIAFLGGIVSFFVVCLHDWGCELKHHPEHKIMGDAKQPSAAHH